MEGIRNSATVGRRAGRRGVALILALLVLTILILLIGQMVLAGGHNKSVAKNATASLQNEYAVRAGYHQATVRILADRDRNPDVDALDDVWNKPFAFSLGEARVSGRIVDIERRFNLSALVNEDGEIVPAVKDQLVRLLQVLGHEPTANAERIADYVDLDTKGAYEAGARNSRLINLQELQRIEGLDRAVLFGDGQRRGILPFLTVWPKEGGLKINPNTAPVELLQSLDEDLTEEIAAGIVAWRSQDGEEGRKNAFTSAADLEKAEVPASLISKISDRLAFKASAFEIRVTSLMSNVERKELYVVKWGGGEPEGEGEQAEPATLQLLSSMREHDYFDLKPDE